MAIQGLPRSSIFDIIDVIRRSDDVIIFFHFANQKTIESTDRLLEYILYFIAIPAKLSQHQMYKCIGIYLESVLVKSYLKMTMPADN